MEHTTHGGPGGLIERGAWIGDGNELAAGAIATGGMRHVIEEIILEQAGFDRAARLARHDEQRAGDINCGFGRPDLRRIGAVENVQPRPPLATPENLCQHFGAEARTAHPEQQDVGEPLPLHLLRKGLVAGEFVAGGLDAIEPAEPLVLVGIGPERVVMRP